MTPPPGPTPTHRETEGHDIPVAPAKKTEGADAPFHVSPLGAVDVTRLPNRSPATHIDVDGQEMLTNEFGAEYGRWISIRAGADQDKGPDAADALAANTRPHSVTHTPIQKRHNLRPDLI
jgi:hypothetical protein